MEECLEIMKKINFQKLQQLNSMNNTNILSKITIPQDHKISLAVKRDLDKNIYTIFDS